MFVSRRIIRPEVGKTELAHERVHRLAGLIGGHGVGTRVSKVMAGEVPVTFTYMCILKR